MKTMKRIAIAMVACFAMMAGTGSVLAQNDGPSYEETVEWLERAVSSIGTIISHDGSIYSYEIDISDDGTRLTWKRFYDGDSNTEHSLDIMDVEVDILHKYIRFNCIDGARCVSSIQNLSRGRGAHVQSPASQGHIILFSDSVTLTKRHIEKAAKIARAFQHLQKLALEKKDLF